MSSWTYINGVINVDVYGKTQEQCEFILKSALKFLPKVYGSERDMQYFINKKDGFNWSKGYFECERYSKLVDIDLQTEYLITVHGSLRDTTFEETLKNFMKWLNRLSKKVHIDEIFVNVKDCYGNKKIIDLDNFCCDDEEIEKWENRLSKSLGVQCYD